MWQIDKKKHWESVYKTKELTQLSWYEPAPAASLALLNALGVSLSAGIIDAGGGDSLFADHLLDHGYSDITVLDISAAAIGRARQRLGQRAHSVRWIVQDITTFTPDRKFDVWHDRALFHFLTDNNDIERYIGTVWQSLNTGGILVLGTFAENGPTKCSGLEVKRYSEEGLASVLKHRFRRMQCMKLNHITPAGKTQEFIYCAFEKIEEPDIKDPKGVQGN